MDVLRYGRDVYGRAVLEGVSWDLIGFFFGLGLAVIIIHVLYRWWLAPRSESD